MNTESTRSDKFQQVADSKDLSQLVRSNTVHYWTTMKNNVDLSGLKPYLGYEGMLAGDPHAGNFAVLPLRAIDGSRKMRYVNVDFDDAGRGPFVLDFIRFVIASKATDSEIKRRPQEKAYIKGLSGKEVDPPKKVRDLLDMPVSQYDAMATDYLRKRSSDLGFVFKEGEIQPYTAKIDRASIERVLRGVKVIDIGIRPLERGGSAGELRIWVLIEAADTKRRIMNNGWTSEFDRPIYFLEHRDGYLCGWCTLRDGTLIVQPHPASLGEPKSYRYPDEIEVIGQITQVAMNLDPAYRRRDQGRNVAGA